MPVNKMHKIQWRIADIKKKRQLLQRWNENLGEHSHDQRRHKSTRKNIEGPELFKSEVEFSLAKMKRNKSVEQNIIVREIQAALDNFATHKITDIIHETYNSCDISRDVSRSIFIAPPKKPFWKECELHRIISLMNHITKQHPNNDE